MRWETLVVVLLVIATVGVIWRLWYCCRKLAGLYAWIIEFRAWVIQKHRDCGCPDDTNKPPPGDPKWP